MVINQHFSKSFPYIGKPPSYLLFVTDPTDISVEKKLWRNFRLLCMTEVEKSEISPHLSCELFRFLNISNKCKNGLETVSAKV